jgi:hypothetical protein
MAEHPNDASRKSKAEGERWSPDSETARDRSDFQSTDEQSGAMTRSLDEEIPNRPSKREDSDVDMDMDTRRSER